MGIYQKSDSKVSTLRRSWAGLLAACLLSCQVFAQTPSIRFTPLSLEDGLSQTTVTAIVQDPAGFMWFGTQDGLNRYDGYQFVHYRHQ